MASPVRFLDTSVPIAVVSISLLLGPFLAHSLPTISRFAQPYLANLMNIFLYKLLTREQFILQLSCDSHTSTYVNGSFFYSFSEHFLSFYYTLSTGPWARNTAGDNTWPKVLC